MFVLVVLDEDKRLAKRRLIETNRARKRAEAAALSNGATSRVQINQRTYVVPKIDMAEQTAAAASQYHLQHQQQPQQPFWVNPSAAAYATAAPSAYRLPQAAHSSVPGQTFPLLEQKLSPTASCNPSTSTEFIPPPPPPPSALPPPVMQGAAPTETSTPTKATSSETAVASAPNVEEQKQEEEGEEKVADLESANAARLDDQETREAAEDLESTTGAAKNDNAILHLIEKAYNVIQRNRLVSEVNPSD